MNRCTWTETITFEKFIHEPHYDEIKNEQRQRQCENMTEEQFDEYGRAYCKEHRIKVDEINKKRQQEFIKEFKENIIKELELIKCRIVSHPLNIIIECEHEQCQEIEELIFRLKLGEFDNE
ncbi:hypothetical protein [Spiroplasma endosymbiont of Colias croceus]|uniref:hypothetical protein n=1 Tax=Spiroplasma endosymbiont of Colias croceus TaxID=3066310 RepID=UPI0030CEAC1D